MIKHNTGKRAELKRGGGIKDKEAKEDRHQYDAAGNYVDKFGKVWGFLGKADDAEQLRQLCQENWLSKNKTWKSTILLQCKWRCLQNGCKFRAIYKKKSGKLFVRGEHDHPLVKTTHKRIVEPDMDDFDEVDHVQEVADAKNMMGEEEEKSDANDDEDEEEEPNFMDNRGTLWYFLAHIKNGRPLAKFCRDNWLYLSKHNKKTTNFRCKSSNRHNCKFRALYLRKDECIYTRDEHNHPIH